MPGMFETDLSMMDEMVRNSPIIDSPMKPKAFDSGALSNIGGGQINYGKGLKTAIGGKAKSYEDKKESEEITDVSRILTETPNNRQKQMKTSNLTDDLEKERWKKQLVLVGRKRVDRDRPRNEDFSGESFVSDIQDQLDMQDNTGIQHQYLEQDNFPQPSASTESNDPVHLRRTSLGIRNTQSCQNRQHNIVGTDERRMSLGLQHLKGVLDRKQEPLGGNRHRFSVVQFVPRRMSLAGYHRIPNIIPTPPRDMKVRSFFGIPPVSSAPKSPPPIVRNIPSRNPNELTAIQETELFVRLMSQQVCVAILTNLYHFKYILRSGIS